MAKRTSFIESIRRPEKLAAEEPPAVGEAPPEYQSTSVTFDQVGFYLTEREQAGWSLVSVAPIGGGTNMLVLTSRAATTDPRDRTG